MKIDKTQTYEFDTFTAMCYTARPDDIPDLVGVTVLWPDGEKVVSRMVGDNIIALPATLRCARCGSYSDKQYLLIRGSSGWKYVVDEQFNHVANLETDAFVCDDSPDGGEFINKSEVHHGMIGAAIMIRIPRELIEELLAPDDDEDQAQMDKYHTMREGAEKFRPKRGDEQLN